MTKRELKDLQLYKSDTYDQYYLSAIYTEENEHGVYEVTIPKIFLPINNHELIIDDRSPQRLYIDLGFGECRMCLDDNGNFYYKRVIEEKIHELTISDIEKKLGYKVKIVSESKAG